MKLFTSDLHWGHKNIVKFTDRHVATTAEEHTEWLVETWNSQVLPGDLVYHLGDFSFFKNYADLATVLKRLNGQKIFIKGNHDRTEHMTKAAQDNLVQKFSLYEEIKVAGVSTVLFHFPIASWHKQGHGSWHLHGHSHGNLNKQFAGGKMLDVGIDNAYNLYGSFSFFTEEMIGDYMETRSVEIKDNHRENV